MMKPTKEEFKLLSNKEKWEVIQNLDDWFDREKILELLLSAKIETLDSKLLGELAKIYNNMLEYEAAMAVLDIVSEEERDAKWYYLYGFSYSKLARSLHHSFEIQAHKTLDMLNKAVVLTKDSQIINDCARLVYWNNLEDSLKNNKEKYPYITEKYLEYIKNEEIMKPEKKKIHKKITIEDIENIDDSWGINRPMWNTINIYDSYEDYIKSAEGFTLEQRYLFAIIWYFLEVNNGGHHQFFFNSTGIVWQDALNGFKHFEMPEFANNFQKVVDFCGGVIPFDRKERFDLLKELEERNKEPFFKMLDETDDFVFKYDVEENELDYIKANPEKFIFDGEYYET